LSSQSSGASDSSFEEKIHGVKPFVCGFGIERAMKFQEARKALRANEEQLETWAFCH
jgi:hypothetical protein